MNLRVRNTSSTAPRNGLRHTCILRLTCLRTNSFVPPPPPYVEVAIPLQRPITALSGEDGNNRADQECRSCRARVQAVCRRSTIRTAPSSRNAPPLFHDRARNLQAWSSSRHSRGGRRAGPGAADRCRFQAPVRNVCSARRFSPGTLDNSTSRGQRSGNLQQAQANTKSLRSKLRLYHVFAPFDGIVQRPSHLGWRTGRARPSPTQLATIARWIRSM